METCFLERWYTNKNEALKYLMAFIKNLKRKGEDRQLVFLLADIFTIFKEEVYGADNYKDIGIIKSDFDGLSEA